MCTDQSADQHDCDIKHDGFTVNGGLRSHLLRPGTSLQQAETGLPGSRCLRPPPIDMHQLVHERLSSSFFAYF